MKTWTLKTWDILSRQTGAECDYSPVRVLSDRDVREYINHLEVAYCRETGEVEYR